VRLSGKASVALENNVFGANGAGIVYEDNARGEARENICRNNHIGIVVADSAAPTLRQNICEGNKKYQIVKGKEARPAMERNVGTVTENAGCLVWIVILVILLFLLMLMRCSDSPSPNVQPADRVVPTSLLPPVLLR